MTLKTRTKPSFSYQLVESTRRKTTMLRVEDNGQVVVRAPKGIDRAWLNHWLMTKESWVAHQLSNEQRALDFSVRLMQGESIVVFGRALRLVWGLSSSSEVVFDEDVGELRICYSSRMKSDVSVYVERKFKEWLQQYAYGHIEMRLAYWSEQMKLRPNGLVVKQFRRRWGSCDGKGVISINTKLALVPLICIDYVLVHELAHLKHFNHSARFWALVGGYQPDYQKIQAELHRRHKVLTF